MMMMVYFQLLFSSAGVVFVVVGCRLKVCVCIFICVVLAVVGSEEKYSSYICCKLSILECFVLVIILIV